MSFSALALRRVLAAHTPRAARGFVVALSGGPDSSCLLTALAGPGERRFRGLPLRAVHVDHGLQPAARAFRDSCVALCRQLGVPLEIVEVRVATAGVSLEAAARVARYRGMARGFGAGECLLTAHHADDQAETLLLQLLRGAGLKGLCGMPVIRPWCGGWQLRPLLDVTRDELAAFAAAAGVRSAADPMNFDPRFDRAYVRASLWPAIVARWPAAARTLSRSADHLAQAQTVLDRTASDDVERMRDGECLSVRKLRALSPAAQRHALRHWIAAASLQPPSASRLTEGLRQILAAQSDHLPCMRWAGHALRRYRDRVYLTTAAPPQIGPSREWGSAPDAALELGAGLGVLGWTVQAGGLDAGRLPARLTVRRRQGGESLRPRPGARRQSLQHLCQSMGVLPWMRDALPLVYAGAELVAVGDLWRDADWCVAAAAPGVGCDWRDAPNLL